MSKENGSKSGAKDLSSRQPGPLILIGGSEDKVGSQIILREVARQAGDGTIVVATLASEVPLQQWQTYSRIFQNLGLQVRHLGINSREEAVDPARVEILQDASAVFMTGGDQLKIVSKLGGTPLAARLRELHDEGCLIAGTSAGATAIGETMLVAHGSGELTSHKVEGSFFMARGLGLLRDIVVDQHFAQRARIERLVGAVAEDPSVLGIGIDENTAVIVERGEMLRVIGAGAVYVADGHSVTYTNVAERTPQKTLALFDVRLHVLCHGTQFDMKTRRPSCVTAATGQQAEQEMAET